MLVLYLAVAEPKQEPEAVPLATTLTVSSTVLARQVKQLNVVWRHVPSGVNGEDGESARPVAEAESAVVDDHVTLATIPTATAT